MIFNGGTIKKLSSHYVGNKSVDGELHLTKDEYVVDKEDELTILNQHFLEPMKESLDIYHLYHEIEIGLNELNHIVKLVFEDNNSFHEHSKQLAQLLFNRSLHPKINPGDFYVVLFNDCIIEGEVVQAIGLFKFETKQVYLKSGYQHDKFHLSIEKGVTQKKIDKGALIFNLNQNDGYKVVLVDKKNNQTEARFWADEFLKIKPIANSYSDTQNYLNLTKQFVTSQLKNDSEINRADQVDLLNKSVNYFKSHTKFDEDEFANEILGSNGNVIESFKKFKDDYEEQKNFKLADDFEISDIAVKKSSKVFKKVIKLDKNFDVYIHGNKDLIERGIDPVSGKKFYKIYFDQES